MSCWDIYAEKSSKLENEVYQESFDFDVGDAPSTDVTQEGDTEVPMLQWPETELSEISCANSDSILQLILPTLAKLNGRNRWITLISPPADINPKLFAYYGIDPSRVLLIHPREDVDDKVTMNKALKNGTSGIVVFWVKKMNKRFLAQWRKSVKQGSSTGVIVNMSKRSVSSTSVALSIAIKGANGSLSIRKVKRFGVDQDCKPDLMNSLAGFDSCMEKAISNEVETHLIN